MDNSGGPGGSPLDDARPPDRWAALFADLEQQWEAQARRDLQEDVAVRTRAERATLGLGDRLGRSAEAGAPVRLRLLGGFTVHGTVRDVGTDWVLVGAGAQSALVPLTAVAVLEGLSERAGGVPSRRRFGLADALRALARDRAVVTVVDRGGHPVTGTIDAVGADHLDLSEHPGDVARRDAEVRARLTLPFTAIAVVRRTG